MDTQLPPGPERLLQHADALRRLARRLVRDDAEADDLVQETWTSVLEKPRDVEPAAGWRRWLFGIARNLARERARSDGRRVRRESAVARPEQDPSGVEIVEHLEMFRVLADELARLDEPYRSTLYRRFFESQTNARIAETDGITEASVRSRHARGLALLRERLDRKQRDWRGAWLVLVERIGGPLQPVASGSTWIWAFTLLLVLAGVGFFAWQARDRPDEDARSVALAPPRTSAPTTARTLDDPESAGSARVVIEPAPLARAPSLRVVDARTSQAVADYLLHFGALDGTPRVTAATRQDGSVPLPRIDGPFDLAVTLVDDPRLDALRREHAGGRKFAWTISVPFRAAGDACTLQVAIGPRWSIRFARPPDVPLESLHAELIASDRGALRATSRAPLREPHVVGGLPWVRFLDEATYLGGAPPYRLRIADEAGLLCGEAFVTDVVGAHAEPIDVELAPRGALEVVVLGMHGAHVHANVTLLRAGRVLARSESGAEPAHLRWIEPGPCDLVVEAAGREPLSIATEVVAGNTAQRSVELEPLAGSGTVSGSAPALGEPVRFELEHSVTRARLETAGRQEGDRVVFEFADVPAGTWMLRAHSPSVWRWSPPSLSVTPPSAGLVLEPHVVDPRNVRAIKFRAFDARTGQRVDHFEVELACDGPEGERARRITGFGNLVFPAVPLDASLEFTVAAEGYRPVRGERKDLQRDGEIDLVIVQLVRGWQRDVVVRDARTLAPIAGARVLVDGVLAGTTDERGVLLLERAKAPRSIHVEHAGWQLAGGSIEADGAWSSATPLTLTAFLRATPDGK